MSILGRIVDRVLPNAVARKVHQIATILRGRPYGFISDPSYNEDGLLTYHVCRFTKEPRFLQAYNKGAATGALDEHPEHRRWRTYISCWAAERALLLEGDFVECGVRLGLYSRAIIDYTGFDKKDKHFYLFDTYEGVPERLLTQREKKNGLDNNSLKYADCYEKAKQNFSEFKNVHVVKGLVPYSLATYDIKKVAYLSLDMSNAKSEIAAINYFWDKLSSGAVIVLHDYAYSEQFSEQHDAFDAFANEHGLGILTVPTGQGLLFKP